MPKLSIIIPIYNVEKYIRECLDSIINQTFTDFEVLMINDGSPDNSGAICDEYAEKDSRFRVFHKENGGVSSARNLGLDNATGEYVTFMDPDDCFIGNDAFDEILKNESFDIQAIFFSALTGKTINDPNLEFHIKRENTSIKLFEHKNAIMDIYPVATACIIDRKVIGDLRFDTSLTVGEDGLFIREVLFNSDKIKLIEETYYFVRQREDSTTRANGGYMKTFMKDHAYYLRKLRDKYENHQNFDERSFKTFCIDAFWVGMHIEKKGKNKKLSISNAKLYRDSLDIESDLSFKKILETKSFARLLVKLNLYSVVMKYIR